MERLVAALAIAFGAVCCGDDAPRVWITVREDGRPAAGAEVLIHSLRPAPAVRPAGGGSVVSPHLTWGVDEFGPRPELVTGPDGTAEALLPQSLAAVADDFAALQGSVTLDGVPVYPESRRAFNGSITLGNSVTLPRSGAGFTVELDIVRPETVRVPLETFGRPVGTAGLFACVGWVPDVVCRIEDGVAEVPLYDVWRTGWTAVNVRRPEPSVRLYTFDRGEGDGGGEGGSPRDFRWSDQVSFADLRAGEMVFLQEGRTLRGRLSEDVPRPVRGGAVVAHFRTPAGMGANVPPRTVAVAEDGTFEIPDVPYDAWALLSAACEGWAAGPMPPGEARQAAADAFAEAATGFGGRPAATPAEFAFAVGPSDDGPVSLPMRPRGTAEVRVTGADGIPAVGVRVRLVTSLAGPSSALGQAPILFPDAVDEDRGDGWRFPAFGRSEAVTDGSGVAVLHDVPAGKASGYQTTFREAADNPFAGWRQPNERLPDWDVRPGETTEIAVELAGPPGS